MTQHNSSIGINPNQPPQTPKPNPWHPREIIKTIAANPLKTIASGIGSAAAALELLHRQVAQDLQRYADALKISERFHQPEEKGKLTKNQAYSSAQNLRVNPDILVENGSVVGDVATFCGIPLFWDQARHDQQVKELAKINPGSESLRAAMSPQERRSFALPLPHELPSNELPVTNKSSLDCNQETESSRRGGGLKSTNQETFKNGTRELVVSVAPAENRPPPASYSRTNEIGGYVIVIGAAFSFGVLLYGIIGSSLTHFKNQKDNEKGLSESEFQQQILNNQERILVNQEKIFKKLESLDNS